MNETLKQRIAAALGNDLSLIEAAGKPAPVRLVEAAGTTIDADEEGFRRLSGDKLRDLGPLTQARMQKMAAYLWEVNLVANRIVELQVAFLLAEGVRLEAGDDETQAVLDRFWFDPINQMDLKLAKKVRELALFGEQCWPAFVNEHNGHVRLGYLDPSQIATVVTDPDNGEQPIGIVTQKDKRGASRRYRVIVNGPEDIFTQRTQAIRATFDDGDAFYFRINDLSSGSRGRSDLLAQIDWLDAYDQFLFGEVDRAQFLRAFLWDVTLTGATPDEVAERAKKIGPPSPGSVRVHNDAEKWDAVTPDLQAGGTAEHARLFRNHILGGASVPEHWYGGAADVNRATGDSMGTPTFKLLSMRQRFIGAALESVGLYVLRQWHLAASRGEPDLSDERFAVTAQWPEMTARDTTAYAAALQQVVVAVGMLIDRGLISEERGLVMVEAITGRLGVPFDVVTELAAAREDALRRAEADVFRDPVGADE